MVLMGECSSFHTTPPALVEIDIAYAFIGIFVLEQKVIDIYVRAEPYHSVLMHDGCEIKGFNPHFHADNLEAFELEEVNIIATAYSKAIIRKMFAADESSEHLLGVTGRHIMPMTEYVDYIYNTRKMLDKIQQANKVIIPTPIILTREPYLMLRSKQYAQRQ